MFGWWITSFGRINLAYNTCCVIQLSIYRMFHTLTVSFYLYQLNESRLDLYNKTLSAGVFLPFHLFRHFKTHKRNFTFSPRISRILMCRYCVHVQQWIVWDSLTVYSILPMTSWRRLSWNRLNRSTVVCPFNFCL